MIITFLLLLLLLLLLLCANNHGLIIPLTLTPQHQHLSSIHNPHPPHTPSAQLSRSNYM
jgi:hypothetical protein